MTDSSSSDNGNDGVQIELDEVAEDNSIDILTFKTCVGALWADGTMAAPERDHISHLIDSIATTEDNRDELRRLAIHTTSTATSCGTISRSFQARGSTICLTGVSPC